MGVGGSASRPSSATSLSRRPSTPPPRRPLSTTTHHVDKPTQDCCMHFKHNHSRTPSRVATPAKPSPQESDSLDDEIEEIVANTLDLANKRRSSAPRVWEHSNGRSRGSEVGGVTQRRILRSGSMKHIRTRQSDQDDKTLEVKEVISDLDFAKFKKVNGQGAAMQNNGRIIHHQESDLLWRLGLITPDAYTITGSRSAPSSNQGSFLKTPSYDLHEEQLMANIEKEFECAATS